MSIDSVMPSNHLIFCGPLLFLPSIFLSISVFSYELALHIRWPEYWNFSISPSNECPGLISFRIDWFDLFAVQGTLKSLLQNHSPKASILQRSLGERVGISRNWAPVGFWRVCSCHWWMGHLACCCVCCCCCSMAKSCLTLCTMLQWSYSEAQDLAILDLFGSNQFMSSVYIILLKIVPCPLPVSR